MPDYKEMYFHLMHETAKAIKILKKAHLDCEEMFLSAPETPIILLDLTGEKGES